MVTAPPGIPPASEPAEAFIAAIIVLLLLQVPPAVISLYITVSPEHRLSGPVIGEIAKEAFAKSIVKKVMPIHFIILFCTFDKGRIASSQEDENVVLLFINFVIYAYPKDSLAFNIYLYRRDFPVKSWVISKEFF